MLTTLPYYSFKSYFANTKLYLIIIYSHAFCLKHVKRKGTAGVPVYLAPWTACPPGGKSTAVAPPPPGGQAVPGYLAPHPGYLHPRGASCPGRFILPPALHK